MNACLEELLTTLEMVEMTQVPRWRPSDSKYEPPDMLEWCVLWNLVDNDKGWHLTGAGLELLEVLRRGLAQAS